MGGSDNDVRGGRGPLSIYTDVSRLYTRSIFITNGHGYLIRCIFFWLPARHDADLISGSKHTIVVTFGVIKLPTVGVELTPHEYPGDRKRGQPPCQRIVPTAAGRYSACDSASCDSRTRLGSAPRAWKHKCKGTTVCFSTDTPELPRRQPEQRDNPKRAAGM